MWKIVTWNNTCILGAPKKISEIYLVIVAILVVAVADDDDVVVAGVGAGDAAALGFSFSSFSFSFSFSGCFDSVVEVGTLEVASDVTGAGVSAGGFAVAAGCVAATSDDMVSGNVSFFLGFFGKLFLF